MSTLTEKRSAELGALAIPSKRPRNEYEVATYENQKSVVAHGPPRTSSLLAPIMLLTGHEGEIYSSKFHPEGNMIASTGFERLIYLWNVYGECDNFHVIKGGHKGAVLDLHFNTDGSNIITASTDKTVGLFDSETGERIKRMKGHNGIVNTCATARRGDPLVASGSDDCTVKIWDTRRKGAIKSIQLTYQITAVSFNDTSESVITGGIDNVIKVWDIRSEKSYIELQGHADTVTGLAVSKDGSFVLSNSMDCTMRKWDIRPFAPQQRCTNLYMGHKHNFEKNLLRCSWSPDDSKIAAGSSDRDVCVWNATNQQLIYKLPGHDGSVNDVQFHPFQPIVMSCSSDKQIYLGEIQ
ncbi:U5 small nuclear ribonucleoprotein 40 kDa protein-like [Ciona intestinalis]